MPRHRALRAPDDLWLTATDLSSLQTAWARVLANQGAAGGDGVGVAAFARVATQRLPRLGHELRTNRYHPGPARAVDVPKRKGGTRRLMIPCVVDRIVQGAVANTLSPVLEPTFSDASYGYRPGRGVDDALRAVAQWRDRGFWHVVEADIVGFFDNVRHDRLLTRLDAALAGRDGAGRLLDLIALLLQAHAQDSGIAGRGLAQGSPLSPLMSNLYLDVLDDALDGRGLRLIRYADDFILLARQRATAEAALDEARAVLAEEGLALHPGGSRVRDFDQGFAFLGDLFVKGMQMPQREEPEAATTALLRQVAQDDARADAVHEAEGQAGYDRGARVLYLTEPGRRLTVEGGSFAVMAAAGHRLAGIAPGRVGRIEIGPGTAADWDAMDLALSHGVALAAVGADGATRGVLHHPAEERAGLQAAQARAGDALAATIARALVDARIRNMRTQLFRLNRDPADPQVTAALAAMQRQVMGLVAHTTPAALRGAEGFAAALYWPALGRLVAGAPQPLRRSRPAADPLNAAINWLTGLLERDMLAAVQASGLHPGFGFLHAPRDGAWALVWDLMEPFRAPLTEGLAAFLFNARRLRPEMFVTEGKTVRIDPAGRRALVAGYESALGRVVNAPGRAVRLAWRPMMRHQALSLAAAVRTGDAARFTPYLMEP